MGTGNSVRALRRARGRTKAKFKQIMNNPKNIVEEEDRRILKEIIKSAKQAGLLRG